MASENHLSSINMDNIKLTRRLLKHHVRMRGSIRVLGTSSFLSRVQQAVLKAWKSRNRDWEMAAPDVHLSGQSFTAGFNSSPQKSCSWAISQSLWSWGRTWSSEEREQGSERKRAREREGRETGRELFVCFPLSGLDLESHKGEPQGNPQVLSS